MKHRIVRDRSAPQNPADLRMDRAARPGWPTGAELVPVKGQHVYCQGGIAEVVRVLGKTGNGSRLLELRLLDRVAPPFHAAASNVLVAPAGADDLSLVLTVGPNWLS